LTSRGYWVERNSRISASSSWASYRWVTLETNEQRLTFALPGSVPARGRSVRYRHMNAVKTEHAVTGRDDAVSRFREEGASSPRFWGNAPGDTYGWHRHDYHKVLFCLDGAITFHTRDGDVELRGGDRLDLPPGTEHAATVGPGGVNCVEASR
jgi:mannose-6-phosphate isomerase-like protein (cupin superfamily)